MVAIALIMWAQSLSARTNLWEALDFTVKYRKSQEKMPRCFQMTGNWDLKFGE